MRGPAFAFSSPLLETEETVVDVDADEQEAAPAKPESMPVLSAADLIGTNPNILQTILSFLSEGELVCKASVVSKEWADIAVSSHADLMLRSVGCDERDESIHDDDDDEGQVDGMDDGVDGAVDAAKTRHSTISAMEQGWETVMSAFPWACFLSEGAFKKVYKVWNNKMTAYEALSIM